MRFGVLGPLVVQTDDGTEAVIGSPSQRTVLAVLLANDGRAVRADVLVDALWGEAPPPSASQSLRTYVSRLRRLVGDRLTSTAGTYALRVDEGELDSQAFESLIDRARSHEAADQVPLLREALALWRGDPYCDVDDEVGLGGVGRRLAERYRSAQEMLAAATLACGDAQVAAAQAEALVADEPLREGAWVVLVRALAGSQRHADALRAYQRAADALADAGLEPGPALREAEAAALDPAPPGPPDGERSNDPGLRSSIERAPGRADTPDPRGDAQLLVGREQDLARVEALLETARVVTLHGPGGVGKTRLASELATRQRNRPGRAVRMVELAPVAAPDAVPVAVADALDLAVRADDVGAALARAGALDVLVILDNCEHVVDAAAEVIELLTSEPGRLQVLATSRERIGVAGEHSWSIAPLPTGGEDSPAVQLFVDRAHGHAPGLVVDAGARAVMARIVDHLDGLPLAIEMAAARLAGLGLDDLDRVLAERIDILRSAQRRGSARHRTLRSVIEWSEQLLDDHERNTLRRLAVFAGPVRADDIEAVLGGPGALVTIADLVERSLAVADHTPQGTRYGLLGVVRRHELGQLEATGEADEMRRRHAEHFASVVRAADDELRTAAEADAVRRIDEVFDELREAHAWSLQRAPATALAISAALHHFAFSREREEGQRWAVDCLPLVDSSDDAVVVLASVAYRANNLGNLADAQAVAYRALELAGDRPVARFPLDTAADTALYRGDLAAAREMGRKLMDAALEAGDLNSVAMGAASVGLTHAYAGDPEAALDTLSSVDLPSLGPSARGWLAYTAAEALLPVRPEVAKARLAEAIKLADSVQHRFLGAVARVSMATLLGRSGERNEALGAFADIIGYWERRGDRVHQLTTLRNLVELFARLEAHEACAELLGAVDAAQEAPTFGDEAALLEAARRRCQTALGADFSASIGVGAARDVSSAAGAALEAVAALRS